MSWKICYRKHSVSVIEGSDYEVFSKECLIPIHSELVNFLNDIPNAFIKKKIL